MDKPKSIRGLTQGELKSIISTVAGMYMTERLSTLEIAERTGYSSSQIYKWLRQCGVKFRKRGTNLYVVAARPDLRATAKADYLAKPVVQKYLRAKPLLDKGMTFREAAKEVGLTINQIAGLSYRERERKRYGLDY